MCLVRLWKIGLGAIKIALWVSQKIIGVVNDTYNFVSKVWIQVNLVEVWAILQYLAFLLDLTMTFCFRDHEEIKFGPRKIAIPEVECLSSTLDA